MNGFTVRYSLTVSSESRTQKRDTLKVNLRIEPSIKCCTVTTFNETLLITHENIFAGAINANFSLTSFFKFFFFLFLSFFWLQLADYFFFVLIHSGRRWKGIDIEGCDVTALLGRVPLVFLIVGQSERSERWGVLGRGYDELWYM